MTDAEILAVLKQDLLISTAALDEYLERLLETARARIANEGITLTASVADGMLIEMYAAWLYRTRRAQDGAAAMPRSLRWALNNRQFSRDGGDSDG